MSTNVESILFNDCISTDIIFIFAYPSPYDHNRSKAKRQSRLPGGYVVGTRTSATTGKIYLEIHALLYIIEYSRHPNKSSLHGSRIDRTHLS